MRVTIVGPCASGKSELARRLAARGMDAHPVAQEHSHVPELWRHEARPDLLVYLSAAGRTIRRRGTSMTTEELREQRRRLASARRHADLRLRTDGLTREDVEARVVAWIERYTAFKEHQAAPGPPSAPDATEGATPLMATAAPARAAEPAGQDGSAPNGRSVQELNDIARRLRRDIVQMTTRAGSGHPSSSMSAIDVMVALYCGGFLSLDPKQPHNPDRDRFILSKGHASPALYAVLAERGFFPHQQLDTLRRIGSPLEGHPNMRRLAGVEASTGSLGQGLSIGLGHALAGRVDGRHFRTYVMTGDGEMDEGQVWEALMSAAHLKLDNLTLIVDHNKAQQSNLLERVLDYRPLADKLRAFHWHVEEIDGHDMPAILGALGRATSVSGRPQAIVAHTVKGKGVSFVEADWTYHGRPISPSDLPRALEELKD